MNKNFVLDSSYLCDQRAQRNNLRRRGLGILSFQSKATIDSEHYQSGGVTHSVGGRGEIEGTWGQEYPSANESAKGVSHSNHHRLRL